MNPVLTVQSRSEILILEQEWFRFPSLLRFLATVHRHATLRVGFDRRSSRTGASGMDDLEPISQQMVDDLTIESNLYKLIH